MLACCLFIFSLMLFLKHKLSWSVIPQTLMLLFFLVLAKTQQFSFMSSMSPTSMMDLQSSVLIALTLWITCLMFQASYKIKMTNNKSTSFSLCSLLLLLSLILCFTASNMLHFYIWFEASLVPTMLLIMLWGYQPERVQASMYLILYTVTASLPLLLMIMSIYQTSNHMFMVYPISLSIPTFTPFLVSLMLYTAFLVKLPLFLVHLWLPKAHVEAPVAGSMILAAILLKLGGYGLMRFIVLFPLSVKFLSAPLISIAMIGAISTSLICLRQPDLKSAIAYASIGHMGLMCVGMLSNSSMGMLGGMTMMIAHAFSSSALFCLANITYESTHTRSLILTKGILNLIPIMSMWWFFMICCNMAAPPSINLLSEIILIMASLGHSTILIIPIMILSFLSVAYSLFIYSSVNHGHSPICTNPLFPMYSNHNLLLIMHLSPATLLILTPSFISNWL